MNTKQNDLTNSQIDALIVQTEAIDTALVAQASENNAKNAKEAKVKAYEAALKTINQQTLAAVGALRQARATEKASRAVVSRLAGAEEQFIKNGDIVAYAAVLYPNDEFSRQNFVNQFRLLVNK